MRSKEYNHSDALAAKGRIYGVSQGDRREDGHKSANQKDEWLAG
jgi:hypothetical protein